MPWLDVHASAFTTVTRAMQLMPCTILLVEDVDDVRELTKLLLEDEGLIVVGAASGREA